MARNARTTHVGDVKNGAADHGRVEIANRCAALGVTTERL
jgi:hypothetical protein